MRASGLPLLSTRMRTVRHPANERTPSDLEKPRSLPLNGDLNGRTRLEVVRLYVAESAVTNGVS